MKITYASKKLEKTFSDKEIQKKYGQSAKRIKMRIDALTAAINLEDLRNAPGRLHALIGDREGQFAFDLKHPFRLVFEPCDTCQPPEGSISDWGWVTEVKILEVVDYHD